MVEENKIKKNTHSLILKSRESLSVTGVVDVNSFDEQTVVAYTDLGELRITGSSLHISKVNLDSGDLILEGNISGLIYSDKKKNEGILSRLFR